MSVNPQPFWMRGSPETSWPLKRLSFWGLSRSLARSSFHRKWCNLASSIEFRMSTWNGLLEQVLRLNLLPYLSAPCL